MRNVRFKKFPMLPPEMTDGEVARFVQDNCDAQESSYIYQKPLTTEELNDYRDKYARKATELDKIELEKKAEVARYDSEIKKVKNQSKAMLTVINNEHLLETATAYLFPDYANNEMVYLDITGTIIGTRQLMESEKQTTIMHRLQRAINDDAVDTDFTEDN